MDELMDELQERYPIGFPVFCVLSQFVVWTAILGYAMLH